MLIIKKNNFIYLLLIITFFIIEQTNVPLVPASISNPSLTDYGLSNQSFLLTENVYESAARLLFLAVKWARSIPSFLEVR